jgi:energy-coupling factor transporter ATP-binding protein EcfA2
MIRTIKIDGFKSIPSMNLDLGRVNCFIGANGVGKSNILEAIGVLGAAANGTVDDESLLRRGVRPGVPRLYKSSFETARTPAHIGLRALGAENEEYRISILNPLENPSPAWAFKTEFLSDGQTEIVSDGVRSKKNLTPTAGLAALQIVETGSDSLAFKLMQRLQGYAIYSPNTPTLRAMMADQQSRDPVGLSGGRLAEGFADFRRTILDKDEDLLDSVFDLIVRGTNQGCFEVHGPLYEEKSQFPDSLRCQRGGVVRAVLRDSLPVSPGAKDICHRQPGSGLEPPPCHPPDQQTWDMAESCGQGATTAVHRP